MTIETAEKVLRRNAETLPESSLTAESIRKLFDELKSVRAENATLIKKNRMLETSNAELKHEMEQKHIDINQMDVLDVLGYVSDIIQNLTTTRNIPIFAALEIIGRVAVERANKKKARA